MVVPLPSYVLMSAEHQWYLHWFPRLRHHHGPALRQEDDDISRRSLVEYPQYPTTHIVPLTTLFPTTGCLLDGSPPRASTTSRRRQKRWKSQSARNEAGLVFIPVGSPHGRSGWILIAPKKVRSSMVMISFLSCPLLSYYWSIRSCFTTIEKNKPIANPTVKLLFLYT